MAAWKVLAIFTCLGLAGVPKIVSDNLEPVNRLEDKCLAKILVNSCMDAFLDKSSGRSCKVLRCQEESIASCSPEKAITKQKLIDDLKRRFNCTLASSSTRNSIQSSSTIIIIPLMLLTTASFT